MKILRMALLFLLAWTGLERIQADPTGKPDPQLVGLWKTVSIVEQGKERPYPNSGSVYYLYKEDGTADIITRIASQKTPLTWRYSTDTAHVPCRLTLINKEGDITRRCIYRLATATRLEVLSDLVNLNAEFPRAFGPGQDEGLMVLQRVEKME